MDSENLKIQLEEELYKASIPIYKQFLKQALLRNSSTTFINEVLQNLIILPDECFGWCACSRNVCETNIRLLIERKIELDRLVKSISCNVSDCSSGSNIDSLPFHIKQYVINLLKSSAGVYKDISYVINESICKSAEYANVNALTLFIKVCVEKGIECRFNTHEDNRHREIYTWILENIRKGEENPDALLGWTCGPDSAIWPSTQLLDYKKTRELLLTIMRKRDTRKYVVW
uniref:Uncharacterized protein n=1 Tax=Photinus pyralis TaxID=7054 RepID=A0A1Y1MVP8_PHOPY